jgi:hypothetical protein
MPIINGAEVDSGNELLDMPEVADAPVTPQVGIAAIALNFALKYHDINTVQDGALYQQYKLEGRNMRDLHLDEVFYTATQIERHLLQAPSRLALAVLDAVAEDIEAALDKDEGESASAETADAQPEPQS